MALNCFTLVLVSFLDSVGHAIACSVSSQDKFLQKQSKQENCRLFFISLQFIDFHNNFTDPD